MTIEEKNFEQFIDILTKNGQYLSSVRSQNSHISTNKYGHLQIFAQILVSNCYSRAYLGCQAKGMDEDKSFQLFLEYLFFLIHCTNRLMMFSEISDPQMNIIMDELGRFAVILSIQTLFPELSEIETDDLFRNCMGQLNDTQQECARYQDLWPKNDERQSDKPLKDTLVWEFSKKIAEFKEEGANIGAIIGEELLVVTILKNIDINSFLEKMK